ncbi:N-terminal kinase-like protein [Actinia tenebrosa]|uniref:N-terminal kinase-like protein n=1 Tax=Actinia tenebrosa TaxID=6105 RepID=A0A6P8IQC7_ACTTE|nr:N-terminal kinase-like protein [Actinia tenebrosa]
MQGLWSLIGKMGTAAQSFPYEIGEKIESSDSKCPWSIHHGKKKATGDPVTVFALDVKASSENKVKLAKSSLKRLKTLRHPNVVTYVDSLETDTLIYLVTEPVVPLEVYLSKDEGTKSDLAISWGIHQIAAGLSFLINDCNLQHGNVSMSSVYVDIAGEWKLGGVEYVQPLEPPPGAEEANVTLLPALQVYDPPEGRKYTKTNKRLNKWSADMWGLGCLIWEIFNGSLSRSASLKSIGKIPKSLVPHYGELVSANPKMRPNPTKFIENCRSQGHYLKNDFVDANLFLRELQIKDPKEQKVFFSSLSSSVDSFPEPFCKHRILPQLINAFGFGAAGSAVLGPLFKVGKLLEAEEYQIKIVPCVVKLFSSTDRATRIQLLQQLDQFVEHLKPQIVDEQIFPHVALGFGDSVPAMREQTVKAMLLLASKLSDKTINNLLLKHFAKLQMDQEAGIRTNTTVCLGKIACHLSDATRQKVLVSAFLRPLRDPFPPARTAGIMAFCTTNTYYSLKDCAMKILPALCLLTMDPERKVRDQAFKAIKLFLGKLEKASEDPESFINKTAAEQTAEDAGSSWTGWAMTSLTSKLYKGGPAPTAGANESSTPPPPAATEKNPPKSKGPEQARGNPAQPPKKSSQKSTPSKTNQGKVNDDFDEGWDDDWGDSQEPGGIINELRNDLMAVKQECQSLQESTSHKEPGYEDEQEAEDSGSDYDDWNNDDWSSINQTKAPQSTEEESPAFTRDGGKSASHFFTEASKSDDNAFDNDPFSALSNTNFKKSGQTSRSNEQTTGSSEGDWGLDDWGSFDEVPSSKPSKSTKGKGTVGDSRVAEGWCTTDEPVKTTSGGPGWDEWNDGWDSSNMSGDSSGMSKAELAKKKREERKQQRLQALKEKKAAGRGPSKLGAVKMQ